MSPSTLLLPDSLAQQSISSIRPLHPNHLRKLRDSGLSDETVRDAGIYSEHDRTKLARMMNRQSWPLRMGAALVLPYFGEGGDIVQHRVRPDNPPKQGKNTAKYLSPTGAVVRVYFPPRMHQRIGDGAVEIIITEGELKSLAAAQAGYCCLGLPGVDCWHRRKSTSLLPDLENINWRGVTVFITFDSDAATNARVRENECLLADTLAKRGAIVRIVRLPSGPDGEKVGLDDYLVAHGAAALRKLMDEASEPEMPEPESLMSEASEADPAKEAQSILETATLGGFPRLRFWRGSWWWWSRGKYIEKPPEEVRAEVTNHLSRDYYHVKARHVSDVMEHLRAKGILSSSIESPTWLNRSPWLPVECLATRSAVIHLPSLVAGQQPFMVDASPAFLTLSATDFDMNLDAPEPTTWLQFLDTLWSDDPESIQALQDWFGYLLTGDTRQHKILMLVGPLRSGKGTIARVLAGLVGRGNVAAPSLGGLATNFGLWPLIGKSVAIIADARLSGRSDQAAVIERLLSVSGEDAVTVDRKNQLPVTLRLPTRFVILTNELPRLTDASGAIVSRMVLLKTTRSFLGHEDHDLTDNLMAELPGILLWAIEGWRRLRERGSFTQPEGGLESLGDMNDLASPIAAFVRDCCIVEPQEVVPVAVLFGEWRRWCESQGRDKYVGTIQTFGRDLSAAVPTIRRRRLREGGDRERIYDGIGLRD